MQKIIRHELVEIPIPAGSTLTRFLIPDLPNLRNVHIFGLQVYFGNTLDAAGTTQAAFIPKGIQTQNNLVTWNVVQTAFMTLVNYGGKEFLKQAPAPIFTTNNQLILTQTNELNFKNFVGQKVNYPKSYIEFTAPPAIVGVPTTFMFSVYYSLPIAEEKKESGFSFSKRG